MVFHTADSGGCGDRVSFCKTTRERQRRERQRRDRQERETEERERQERERDTERKHKSN